MDVFFIDCLEVLSRKLYQNVVYCYGVYFFIYSGSFLTGENRYFYSVEEYYNLRLQLMI